MQHSCCHAPDDLRVEDTPTAGARPRSSWCACAYGGICGSDLHYYQHGGFGTVRIKEPMVLGHEVVGHRRGGGQRRQA